MLPHLCIRLATVTDLIPLSTLVQEVFDTRECGAFFQAHCGATIPKVCLEGTLIAEQRGVIVGFLLWGQDEFLGVVTGIGVRLTHRRFGVASLLVETAVEKMRTDGLRVLDVVCDAHIGPCFALFEKHKFRVVEYEESHVLLTRRLVGGRNRGDGFHA
jgi:ribosomal protein S18 acetylase RimI-like enzyme